MDLQGIELEITAEEERGTIHRLCRHDQGLPLVRWPDFQAGDGVCVGITENIIGGDIEESVPTDRLRAYGSRAAWKQDSA